MMMPHIKQSEHLKTNLEAIKLATNNFAAENYIGEGGFGEVYKGEIDHYEGHMMAAFKRLNHVSGSGLSKLCMVRQAYKRNVIKELIYGKIKDEILPSSLEIFTSIAIQCLEIAPKERPLAIKILRALETALHVQIKGIKFERQHVGILNLRLIKQ
ncbi:protein kinase, ATP binding site-containing protein [Tanacetum coccineum]